ncbi:MAG: MFS transporter [Sphingobium sp.]|nr:MFS transporter [Sphingobium sp.]
MTDTSATIDKALQPGHFSPRLILSLSLCAAVMVIDGYDLAAMPLAVPHVTKAFGLSAADFGTALSAVLLGLGLGAILIAPLGDKYGRRRVIVIATTIIGLMTLGTATGTSIWEFTLWRLGTGIALGACLPNITALTSEIAPPDKRASTLTIVSLGISLGAIVAGLIVPQLVAIAGWHAIFTIPGLFTLILAVILHFLLPTSSVSPQADTASPKARPPMALLQLLRPPLLVATATFALLYGINAFALYLITSWLPTLLPQAGFSVDMAARYLSLLQFGGFLIGLLLARLLDYGHATAALAGIYVLIALALALFSVFAPDPVIWGALILIAGGGISGAHLAIMAVAAGFFPAHLLSSAIGFGVAVARIGAIGGPLLGGTIIGSGASVAHFFLIAAIPAIACLLTTLLIPIAQRQSKYNIG